MPNIQIDIKTSERFKTYFTDWDYSTYLSIGGYGSGKSHNTAGKILLKCLMEKRDAMVVRKTYRSHRESTFKLMKQLLNEWGILETNKNVQQSETKIIAKESPMELRFPAGNTIIFQGLDNTENIKSTHGISIIWVEECSQITERQYEELRLRARTPGLRVYFLLTCNPVSVYNWVYNRFFIKTATKSGVVVKHTILAPDTLYKKKTVVRNGVYYHHSTVDDNPALEQDYIKRLDEIKEFDEELYGVARLGHFGISGTRVLPQFEVATDAVAFKQAVNAIPQIRHFTGVDWGYETSYNAVVQFAVDQEKRIMYIYNEIYQNHVTDDVFAEHPKMKKIKAKHEALERQGIRFNWMKGDSSEPKAIRYYQNQGYYIRACNNRGVQKNKAGSRLENTKKVKRCYKIICSPACPNVIRELEPLAYKEDSKGVIHFDQFETDPHTLSAIWYGWDNYEMSDFKYDTYKKNNSYSSAS